MTISTDLLIVLIESLKEYAKKNNYHTILARVAADLPANKFWDKMNFRIFRQEPGGRTTGRLINIRGYSLEDNNLLSGLSECHQMTMSDGPILSKILYA